MLGTGQWLCVVRHVGILVALLAVMVAGAHDM